jgi:hypothetical protein
MSVGPKGLIINRDCAFPFLGAAGGRKKSAPVKPDEGEEGRVAAAAARKRGMSTCRLIRLHCTNLKTTFKFYAYTRASLRLRPSIEPSCSPKTAGALVAASESQFILDFDIILCPSRDTDTETQTDT